MSLQTDMNSIKNGWDSRKRVETRLIFIVVPQVRTKMREKGKREKNNNNNNNNKNMTMSASKENTLTYIHMFFLYSTKLKIVWKKITTSFKRHVHTMIFFQVN